MSWTAGASPDGAAPVGRALAFFTGVGESGADSFLGQRRPPPVSLETRMRVLEARGFVYRKYEAKIPPAVTYGLTSRMDEMRPMLEQLDCLARRWYEEDLRAGPVPAEAPAEEKAE